MQRLPSFLAFMGALVLFMAGFFFLIVTDEIVAFPSVPTIQHASTTPDAQTASVEKHVSSEAKTPVKVAAVVPAKETAIKPQSDISESESPPPENQITRVQNPYPFPPHSATILNENARAALVNILCTQTGGGFAKSISGSGVIIDPRGVILTNAHIAQYVLLSKDPRINISCTIRAGAPASPRWIADILYISPAWVEAHADEINMAHPLGTGEHDYGLLLIEQSLDASPLPPSFPFIAIDSREAIGFKDDEVLVASYPLEFIGDVAAQFNLYPLTSITTIKQLLTFVVGSNSVDVLSLGGIASAQGGSSGGAVVNAWGFLVGLISTTSEGETTATRDLRAISLSYINRDLLAQTQSDLGATLGGNVFAQAQDFNIRVVPDLLNHYIH